MRSVAEKGEDGNQKSRGIEWTPSPRLFRDSTFWRLPAAFAFGPRTSWANCSQHHPSGTRRVAHRTLGERRVVSTWALGQNRLSPWTARTATS